MWQSLGKASAKAPVIARLGTSRGNLKERIKEFKEIREFKERMSAPSLISLNSLNSLMSALLPPLPLRRDADEYLEVDAWHGAR